MAASAWDLAIGQRLRRLRERRGWSMTELGARCAGAHATASQINKLEKGRQQFNAQWLYRLAGALDCPVCDLLIDTPARAPAEERALLGQLRELAEPDRQAITRLIGSLIEVGTMPEGSQDCRPRMSHRDQYRLD